VGESVLINGEKFFRKFCWKFSLRDKSITHFPPNCLLTEPPECYPTYLNVNVLILLKFFMIEMMNTLPSRSIYQLSLSHSLNAGPLNLWQIYYNKDYPFTPNTVSQLRLFSVNLPQSPIIEKKFPLREERRLYIW
jgi:hypothetical protein